MGPIAVVMLMIAMRRDNSSFWYHAPQRYIIAEKWPVSNTASIARRTYIWTGLVIEDCAKVIIVHPISRKGMNQRGFVRVSRRFTGHIATICRRI